MVLLSVGHDEYWSGGQRANVESARAAGVHLAFFSGNEVFWKTRWENGLGADGAPYRTLVSYKESHPGTRLDPLDPNVWTGSWRDPRYSVAPTLDGLPVADGGRPENGLTGTIFTVNSVPNQIAGISRMVPWADGKMRFCPNRNMATSSPTDRLRRLPGGPLGYECDKDLDNGARPAGLFHLSTTDVPTTEHIVDYGHNYGFAPATHHMTVYRHVSATNTPLGLVFSAGSIQFAWGVDNTHDGDLAPVPDARLQQATVNLFADMGVQPGSLRVGLLDATASGDTAPPASTIVSVLPASLQVGTPATISRTGQDFGVGDATSTPALLGALAGVEVSVDSGTTWHPATGREAWTYTWTPTAQGPTVIKTRAVDDSGNLETTASASNQLSVTVAPAGTPSCPCRIWTSPPTPVNPAANDAQPLELGVRFHVDISGSITALRFYKPAGDLGTHIGHLWSNGGVLLGTATFAETASGWQEGTLTAVAPLSGPVAVTANTTYVASFSTSSGRYGADTGYFAAKGQDNFPLHALRDGIDGRNGVFALDANVFPTRTSDSTNYWVDVVFNLAGIVIDTKPDTTPPTITGVTATTGPNNPATIHWTTNEPSSSRVDHGTAPDALNAIASDGSLVTTHNVILTALTPNTASYFRVQSVDGSVNSSTSPAITSRPASFAMPGAVLTDTTVADFNAGIAGVGYKVAPLGDGAVTLAPDFGSDFSGPALPPGWSTCLWSDGCIATGTGAVVGGGFLTVDGGRVSADALFSPDRALEFVAQFAADPFQHAGLGTTFAAPPWAMFSTNAGDGRLYARTHNGAIFTDQPIQPPLGAPANWNTIPHRFRIDWTASNVIYSIDGIQVAEHQIPITVQLRPIAASDFSAGSGTIVVDWLTMDPPYASPGTFISRVFDAGAAVSWGNLIWTSQTPIGTTLGMSVRTGNTLAADGNPDARWTPFAAVSTSGGPIGGGSRYIQYRAQLSTTDPAQTPVLPDVTIGYTTAATPTITWSNPAAITYGTPLGPTQLNATANTLGTFSYTPDSGVILGAGAGQTLSVTFTPADPVHYTTATKSVTINVLRATPTITWNNPADMTYGAALSATQLNATANVAGTFGYNPIAGTTLNAGAGQTLSVTFMPNDTANYIAASKDVAINVLKAPLTVTASNRTKTYGQAVTFAGTEFTTSGLVNGDTVTSVTLTSSGAAATATVAGSPYSIVPSAAIGTRLSNYSITYVNGALTVNAATLTVTAGNRTKTHRQAVTFAGTEFTTSGLVNGDTVTSVTLTTSGAAATATVVGSPYSIVPRAATGTGLGNYSITYVSGSLTVNAATLTVTASNRTKTYGQAVTFAGTEFTTSGLVNGDTVTSVTLTLSGAVATATVVGSPYSIAPSVAIGTRLCNYSITYVNGALTVNAATLTVTASNRTKTYGQAITFAGTEFTTSGLVNGDTVTSATLTSSGAAATATVVGSPYSIVPSAATGTGVR